MSKYWFSEVKIYNPMNDYIYFFVCLITFSLSSAIILSSAPLYRHNIPHGMPGRVLVLLVWHIPPTPHPPLQDPHSVHYPSIIHVFDYLVLFELERDNRTLNLCYASFIIILLWIKMLLFMMIEEKAISFVRNAECLRSL